MRRSIYHVYILLILLCIGIGSQAQSVQFTTSGGAIRKNGIEFTIHGVNANVPGLLKENEEDAKHRLSDDVHCIADLWKFNAVRLNCSIKPAVKTLKTANTLDEIVQAYTARGIVVIIAPRDHVGSFYQNPPMPDYSPSLIDLSAFWKTTAAQYRNNPYVWFEVMADPGNRDERTNTDLWLDAHDTVIHTIRQDAAAPNMIVCCGNYKGCEDGNVGALSADPATSAILTYGPRLAKRYPNIAFDFSTLDGWDAGGAIKLNDYLDRAAAAQLPIFVAEYGLHPWGDTTYATDAVLAAGKARKLGHCVWQWRPDDRSCLCATDNHNGGWEINQTDGTRPTNLSWLGDRVWIDTHTEPFHGPSIDRTGWTATSFAPEMRNDKHYNRADQPLAAYVCQEDYWRSEKGQEPGQWFQVDMGTKHAFTRVQVDTGAQVWDFPRGYALYVSNDGMNWGSPIAQGKNDQSILRISFPVQNARYLKLVDTAKTWRYWVIGNFEVFAPFGTPVNRIPTPAGEKPLDPHGWRPSGMPATWTDLHVPLRPLQSEWSRAASNRTAQPGDYYQIDLSEPQTFHKIVCNVGRFMSDFPRGYEVYVSIDGIDWGKPVATGRGAPLMTIAFAPTTARYIRIVETRTGTSQWVIMQLQVYGTKKL